MCNLLNIFSYLSNRMDMKNYHGLMTKLKKFMFDTMKKPFYFFACCLGASCIIALPAGANVRAREKFGQANL